MSINEWSAHGQSDIKLEHKGQAGGGHQKNPKLNLNIRVMRVADTKINRLENVPNYWDVFLEVKI